MADNNERGNNSGNNGGNGDSSRRGFAAMPRDKQREIAAKGGRMAHEKGTAHEFDSEEAREAGRRGGQARSNNSGIQGGVGAEGSNE